MLEYSSSIPLYEQVKRILSYDILSGKYQAGDQLLNENKLCDLYKVSRTTIRRTLKELENEGLVEINHGKGTFVKKQSININQMNIGGYTNILSGENHSTSSKILNKEIIPWDAYIGGKLKLDPGGQILKLKRIIYDGQIPLSIDISFFPLSLYPGISEKIGDNVSTFNLIKNEYGMNTDRFYKELSVISGSVDLSKRLQCSPFDPLFNIEKTMYNEDLQPIHFSNYYIIAKHVKYFLESK